MIRKWLPVVLVAVASLAIAEPLQLSGTYVWSSQKNKIHDLTAVVSPAEDGTMQITYSTTWGNKPKTFVGTIAGDLEAGTVSGQAVIEGGKRTWLIRGKADAGVITCDHYELRTKDNETKEIYTGTVTLAPTPAG